METKTHVIFVTTAQRVDFFPVKTTGHDMMRRWTTATGHGYAEFKPTPRANMSHPVSGLYIETLPICGTARTLHI